LKLAIFENGLKAGGEWLSKLGEIEAKTEIKHPLVEIGGKSHADEFERQVRYCGSGLY